ncbi:MAG: type II secretion system F family protein [Acidilobus sp.]
MSFLRRHRAALEKAFYVILGVALLLDGVLVLSRFPSAFRFITYGVVPVPYGPASILALQVIIVLAVTPALLAFRRRQESVRELKYQSRVFLQIYPSLAMSAQSVGEALDASVGLVDSPLRELIKAFSDSYRLTGDLEEAFRRSFSSAPRDVRLLLSSIVVAGKSGGRVKEVLEIISRYAAELDRMEFTLFNRLRSYAMVVYMGVAVYGVVAGIGISIAHSFSGIPFLGSSGLSPVELKEILGFLYYALLVMSAASSYVMAKIIDDYAPKAFEYFTFLSSLGSVFLIISTAIVHVI